MTARKVSKALSAARAKVAGPRGAPHAGAADLRPEDIRRRGARTGRRVGRFLSHGVWSTRVIGQERVPRTGPVILAANHTGVIDGPVLVGASPRGAHVIIKQEMFRGLLGRALHRWGQIPVDRRSGRAALKAALALLEEGRVVGIFPEGTRGTGAVASAQAGVAFLAVHSGAPVVPVAILGTRPTGKGVGHVPRVRSRLHVVFGEPFQAVPGDAGTGRAALQAAMERIQEELSAHVDAAAGLTGVGLPEEVGEGAAGALGETTRALRGGGSAAGWGHEITVTRRMSAPPEGVWAVLTDLDGATRTLRGVTKIEVLTPGDYGVGTGWRETRRMLGKEETEEMWVTAADAPRRTVVEADHGSVHYTTTFTLRPAGTGTQVDVTFGAVSRNPGRVERALWRVFGRVGAAASRKALERDLEDIAAASSARAAGSA